MKIILRRTLKDYDAWKKMVSERNEMRQEYGSRGVTVYRNAGNSREVYLVFEWDDHKPWKKYFDHPEVQKVLEETGTTEVFEVSESFHLEA